MSFNSRSLNPPTETELARWSAIKSAMLCTASNKSGPVEIHHLLSDGGLRIGHRYSVGLDQEVHAIVKTRKFKADWPNQKLLDRQDDLIDWPRVTIPARPERKRASQCIASSKTYPRPRPAGPRPAVIS